MVGDKIMYATVIFMLLVEFNLVISAPLELMSFKNNSQNYLYEKIKSN